MTAPVVEAVQTSFRSTAATSHVVVLPAGTIIGSRVTVEMATGRNNLAPGTTWPAGWVELVDNTPSEGGVTSSFAYCDYLATPPANITVTTVNTCRFSAVARRLSNFDTATPPAVAFLSNTPDPPNLVFPWGTEETLVGTTFVSHEDPFPDPVDPLPNSQQSILSTQTRVDSCTNTVTAGSINPAAWQPGGAETSARTVTTWAHRGPSAADPVVGALAVTLPALSVAATGTATAAGAAQAVLPALSVAMAASAAADGVLGAVLPALGVALDGAAAADGALAATLPALVVDLAASTADVAGTLTAVLPALDGTLAGTATAAGALAAGLPPLDVALAAAAAGAGALDGVLPALLADLQGTVEGPPVADLTVLLPALGLDIEASASVAGELGATLPALTWGAVGHAGDMSVPLCEPWPLPENCAAPTGTPEAVMAASSDLWVRSGQQYGYCTVPLRPCRQDCTPSGWRPRSWWDGITWPVMRGPGLWWNAVCGSCRRTGCGCNDADTLELPETATSIVEVIVDGVVLPADAYVLWDGYKLVRRDGERWPLCQDWTIPVSGVGAWSVTAVFGRPVPPAGSFALAQLAAEYAAFCTTGQCRLPAYTTGVSRQGVDQTFPSIVELTENGLTGLDMVDRFLNTYNPGRLQDRPRFHNPDTFGREARTLTGGT